MHQTLTRRLAAVLTLAAVALLALAVADPAYAFDPQPDPPLAWWDAIARVWRWLGR